MKIFAASSNPKIVENAIPEKIMRELNSKSFISSKNCDAVFRLLEDAHYERNEEASFDYPVYEITVKKIGDYEITSQFCLDLDTEFIPS